ncbi:type 1 glutamine amidotransferase domain-containing protein [Patulibacter minatonensis]|uniref:type 1 glutamine amidotransferase domain-containing protein n=1 Tax=Patulibacter minatonensis TaxID=298163 RepID=UPI000684C085|nr:type 1 glutamine amidotransferase domain-containing protein [Patulibacter minatonensis]
MSTPDSQTHHVLFLLTGASAWTLVDGSKHPTGFWADELVAPHRVFSEAGWRITVATPGGVTPPLDESSLEPANAGGDAPAAEQRAYLDGIRAELEASVAIEDVDPRDFDVVFVPGGHGPMEDLAVHAPTGRILTALLDDDMKLVAAVCHGPAALLAARRADGSWPFAGRTLTAFTNEEEHQAGLGEIATWLLEDRLRDGGSAFEYGEPWAPFLVEDKNLHTGQNPASAGPLAERLVEIVVARDEAAKALAEVEADTSAD